MEQNLSLLLTLQLQHTQSQKKRLFSTTLRKIKEKRNHQKFPYKRSEVFIQVPLSLSDWTFD